MPCHAAVTEKFIALSPDHEVGEALDAMKKAKVDTAPVVDADGKVVGVFSHHVLLKNLLPVSVAMGGGAQTDIRIGAAPGIAKRLKKIYPLKIGEIMDRKFPAVHPETPLWEGIGLLVQNGMPLLVIDGKSGKAQGVMNFQSALDELNRIKDSEA